MKASDDDRKWKVLKSEYLFNMDASKLGKIILCAGIPQLGECHGDYPRREIPDGAPIPAWPGQDLL